MSTHSDRSVDGCCGPSASLLQLTRARSYMALEGAVNIFFWLVKPPDMPASLMSVDRNTIPGDESQLAWMSPL